MSRLDALVAREGKDGKTHWTKIGAAFPNKGGGYSVVLDALPLDGKIVLKVPLERTGDSRDAGGRQARVGREPGDDDDQPNW